MSRKTILKQEDLSDIIYKYYTLELSTTDIAKEYNCSDQTVGRFLTKNGYVLRSKSEGLGTKNAKDKISKSSSNNWKDEKFRTNQIKHRLGKPSGTKGKHWKNTSRVYDHKGSNNPCWKNGKTKLSFAIRNSDSYKKWRNQVFKRDNYTCQCCDRRNCIGDKVVLECHHIKPLSIIIDENNITSLEDALLCEAIFDINNGQTLCKECHKKTDSYGVNLKHCAS